MSRVAKPIELLLKLKQIKPDLEFTGADKVVYDEFMDAQAEENLLATLRENEEQEDKKVKKKSKKVKQTIDPETVEMGEMEPMYETVDFQTAEEIQPEENNESF